MISIGVWMDAEPSHTLQTLQLAVDLRASGYRVVYFGAYDTAPLVTSEGFEFIPTQSNLLHQRQGVFGDNGFSALVAGGLEDALLKVKPDLILVSSIFLMEALLVRYRYKVPVMLFTCTFPSITDEKKRSLIINRLLDIKTDGPSVLLKLIADAGKRIARLSDAANLILEFHELIALPEELDEPLPGRSGNRHYIGPSIYLNRKEHQNSFTDFGSAPIVFASLGSQASMKPSVSARFFQTVIDAFAEMPDQRLVLSIGRGFRAEDFCNRTPNITISNWAPQIELLRRSELMITHAGLATVKECILTGVPMLLFPLMRDQFDCAARMEKLGLGIAGDLATISAVELRSLLSRISASAEYRKNLERIKASFGNYSGEMAVQVVGMVAREGLGGHFKKAANEGHLKTGH
jgi:MGT family glycosyltransferase